VSSAIGWRWPRCRVFYRASTAHVSSVLTDGAVRVSWGPSHYFSFGPEIRSDTNWPEATPIGPRSDTNWPLRR
jgi:hypothetical protein